MSTTIISASVLPSFCDCPRRAAANGLDHSDPADERATHNGSVFRAELEDRGFKLRTLQPGIGAAIGTAVDAGTTAMLRDTNAPTMDIALASFHAEIANGVEYDSVTPNPNTAEKQIHRMLSVVRTQVAPHIEPLYIQAEFTAKAGTVADSHGVAHEFKLVGHPDVISTELRIHDTKTGARPWPAIAQMGGYALLAKANGLEPTGLEIDYIPRAAIADRHGKSKPQPGAEVISYDVEAARAYAVATIKAIRRSVVEFRETNSPDAFAANPMSQLCLNKFCSARGTKFCKVWKR